MHSSFDPELLLLRALHRLRAYERDMSEVLDLLKPSNPEFWFFKALSRHYLYHGLISEYPDDAEVKKAIEIDIALLIQEEPPYRAWRAYAVLL